jgi:hypothetical protein
VNFSKKFLFGFFLSGMILVSFNNCGQSFKAEELPSEATLSSNGLFQSAGCEGPLMDLYSRTYYPFLSTTCKNCHINGPGIGQFASPDFTTSYNSFMSMGRMKIHNQALNAAHQPAYTGPQNASRLNPFLPMWDSAEANYKSCMAGTGTPVTSAGLVTLQKSNATIITKAAGTWTKITWDLETEVADPQQIGIYKAQASIEVRVALVNGIRRGYEFRNPTLLLKVPGTSYTINGIKLSINNSEMVDVSTYSQVSMTVSTTTETNLAPGAALALAVMDPIAATDTFAIEFVKIE